MSVNQIDSEGIQTKTLADIISALELAFQTIYGSDINLDQNSPDGQLLNEIAVMCSDFADFITQDYSSKDPDQAVGVALDAASQYCGIIRNGGTYTEVDIDITTDRALNLSGQSTSTPFTISDSNGNEFQLIDDESLSLGLNTVAFRAVEIGNIQISLNTLTTISTPILGVLSVNNPDAPTQQGEDQETDAELRLRRQASVALPAQGSVAGLIGGLYTVDGVVDVAVFENTTASVDGDGIPAHGIWVIVDGGSDADVGAMIYLYRPLGIPMAGSETATITQVDSSTIDMKFDRAVDEDLYINLTISSKTGGSIDSAAIKAGIVAALSYGINETADVSTIINAVYDISTDAVVSAATINIYGGATAAILDPSAKKNKFVLSTANITITVV